jgi:tRNA(Ile)-lysidine synthase
MDASALVRFIKTTAIFSPEDTVLLAVSGGIDSVVMVNLFSQAKLKFGIAHCNFMLRGDESNQDEQFVRQLALQSGVPYYTRQFQTEEYAQQKGISIQMAARELRYDWFEQVRKEEGFNFVATAHHLDDQAETFLINLLRGTGIAGLHGIPVRNNFVVRPLMFAYRKEIVAYAGKNKITFRVDGSNSELKYLRNKIRHELLPVMCRINPDFAVSIHETIRRIHDFETIGNTLFESWKRTIMKVKGEEHIVDLPSLRSQVPTELYAWMLLSPYGFSETQVSNLVVCLSKEDHKVFLSPTHKLVKERKTLVITEHKKETITKPVRIDSIHRTKRLKEPVPIVFQRVYETAGYLIPANEDIASLDADKVVFPLVLRKWKSGDAFYPLGMKKRKKLSDFFIDRKLSLREKEQVWLLCSDGKIAWVIGHRIDHRFRITSSTKEILRITLLPK